MSGGHVAAERVARVADVEAGVVRPRGVEGEPGAAPARHGEEVHRQPARGVQSIVLEKFTARLVGIWSCSSTISRNAQDRDNKDA